MKRMAFFTGLLAGFVLFAGIAVAVELNVPCEYSTNQTVINTSNSADLDGNFFVDFFDYTLMSRNRQQFTDPCDPQSGDIIEDGIVDFYDLAGLCNDWLVCFVAPATVPQPANNAPGVSTYAILRWSPGENSISHDVYFGTNFNEVDAADTASSGVYMGNQDANFWNSNNYSAELDTETTYYWRVDEKGPACSAKGSVWSFTTAGLDPDLADWWKFDETSGMIAHDSVGVNNGAVNGAAWITGKFAGALSFNGIDNYVNCGSGAGNYDNITVSAWMQTSTAGALVSNRYNSGSYGTWYTLSSTNIEIGDNRQGGYRNLTFNTPTLDGSWHHIVYTKDGINHAIYVDGSLDQNFTSDADISSNVPLFIANRWARSGDNLWFNGIIDDVRIYSRALTANEAALLYQQGQ